MKFHFPEVKRELSNTLNSRQLFTEMKESFNFSGLTDIQRAARFFMIIKTSYGSKGNNFGCIKKNINNMINYLETIQSRLESVIIENLSFEKIIPKYDKPNTFFYLDLPYYGTEKYYQVTFSEKQHRELAEIPTGIKGKFLLSYNDCEYIRNLYSNFNIDTVYRNNNLLSKYSVNDRNYKELLIKNYY